MGLNPAPIGSFQPNNGGAFNQVCAKDTQAGFECRVLAAGWGAGEVGKQSRIKAEVPFEVANPLWKSYSGHKRHTMKRAAKVRPGVSGGRGSATTSLLSARLGCGSKSHHCRGKQLNALAQAWAGLGGTGPGRENRLLAACSRGQREGQMLGKAGGSLPRQGAAQCSQDVGHGSIPGPPFAPSAAQTRI